MKDLREGRTHFNSAHGSYLDQYVVKSANGPDGTPGKFATLATTTNLICLTTATLHVPTGTSGGGGIDANMVRSCAPGDASIWAQAPRNTIGTSGGLGKLMAYYGLSVKSNQVGTTATNGLKTAAFGPATMGVGQEVWGQIYVNSWGSNATAVEIFALAANWY
jgi:hypothetical protein